MCSSAVEELHGFWKKCGYLQLEDVWVCKKVWSSAVVKLVIYYAWSFEVEKLFQSERKINCSWEEVWLSAVERNGFVKNLVICS